MTTVNEQKGTDVESKNHPVGSHSIEDGRVKNEQGVVRPGESSSASESAALITWQMRLLPLMSLLLVGLTAFFLVASVFQLYGLKTSILNSPRSSLEEQMQALRPDDKDLPGEKLRKARLAMLVQLEANSLERRYHQANTLVLGRVWTIYLGFLTGMILALVGAAFILGKLREEASHVDLGGAAWRAAVQSSSPGLILAVLGTSLMIVTILARVDVSVNDRPLFITDVGIVDDGGVAPIGNEKITVAPEPSPSGGSGNNK
jgi:hypothetical protein